MSFAQFVDLFTDYVNTYSGLPGIVFCMFFWKSMGNVSRLTFYILLASFLSDFGVQIFIRYVYPNSYIISNVWYIINYLLVSWLFVILVPNRKMLLLILAVTFVVGTLISFSFFYSFLESNTFTKTFSSVVFTVISILVFLDILKESPSSKLLDYPVFWINTGIFLFSSISLLRNLFTNYLVFTESVSWELVAPIALFAVVFNIAKNLMIFYAFILVKKGFPDYIHPPNPSTA